MEKMAYRRYSNCARAHRYVHKKHKKCLSISNYCSVNGNDFNYFTIERTTGLKTRSKFGHESKSTASIVVLITFAIKTFRSPIEKIDDF